MRASKKPRPGAANVFVRNLNSLSPARRPELEKISLVSFNVGAAFLSPDIGSPRKRMKYPG
jgi:hypothetical protein